MRCQRLLITLLALLLAAGGAVPAARAQESGIRSIYISGVAYPGTMGDMVGDYAALQVRQVLEALGYRFISWSPEDGSTTIYDVPEGPVVLRPGDPVVRLRDRTITLPFAPYVKEGKLHAPAAFFREVTGARIDWVTATREIEITPAPYGQTGSFGPEGAGAATFAALGRDGEGRLYLAVADGPRRGVWRSDDHAATWELVDAEVPADLTGGVWAEPAAGVAPPEGETYQVVAGAGDSRWIWALTSKGVQVSQDGGLTWQLSPGTEGEPEALATYRLVPGVGQELFLLTGPGGVRYSPNGGGQWFRLTGYWPDAQVLDGIMDGERLLLATTAGGVIIPKRMEYPWAKALPRLAPVSVDWGEDLSPVAGASGTLWLDPQQPDTAYAQVGPAIWKTTDGGDTWEPLPLPFEAGAGPLTFFHHPTESGHYGLREARGIHVTRDGGATWSFMPVEFTERPYLTNLMLLASGRLLGAYESLAGSRLVYTDDLQGFQYVNGPSWHITSMVANPADPDRLYACDWNEAAPCQVSHDGGATWQPLAAQPPREAGPPIALQWDPAAPDELIAGRFVSRDGGATWEPLPFFSDGERILTMSVSPVAPQIRAAAVQLTNGLRYLWLTRDGGETWSSLGSLEEAGGFYTLRFDARGRLWAATGSGLWRFLPGE